MINLQKEKTPIKELDPKTRINSNDEVIIGYSKEEAYNEATRCLHCKNQPCVTGCPLHNDIPSFIKSIVDDDLPTGVSILSLTSTIPFVCSRVCDQEKQCEKNCTRGLKGQSVAIGMLERYLCDNAYDKLPMTLNLIPLNGYKVAIIGSGPSGLACAEKLGEEGFKVDVYEKLPFVGGLLEYGIPDFRLNKETLRKKVEVLKSRNVNFILNTKVGEDISFKQLEDSYDYIYIALGADTSKTMHLENETLDGVITSDKYLLYLNKPEFYQNTALYKRLIQAKNVVVVGGGNVAMDVSRVARRHGANVKIVYRRSKEEMPARDNEIQDARNEGVEVNFLTNPVKINGKEKLNSITCVKMELGEPDESGRRRPVPINDSEFDIECDLFVYAIGSGTETKVMNDINVNNKWGFIEVNENNQTSKAKVFAGGDVVTGPNTVVHAVRDGLKIAKTIIEMTF